MTTKLKTPVQRPTVEELVAAELHAAAGRLSQLLTSAGAESRTAALRWLREDLRERGAQPDVDFDRALLALLARWAGSETQGDTSALVSSGLGMARDEAEKAAADCADDAIALVRECPPLRTAFDGAMTPRQRAALRDAIAVAVHNVLRKK